MIRQTVVVNRPIEQVFAYGADFARHPEWQTDLKGASFEGPLAVGATGTETRQMGPRVHTYGWRLTEYDAPNSLAFETMSGPMRPAGRMAFTSSGDATTVEFTMTLNPRGFMKLLSPMITKRVQQQTAEHMVAFKQQLESD